jgi:hypothetical protein
VLDTRPLALCLAFHHTLIRKPIALRRRHEHTKQGRSTKFKQRRTKGKVRLGRIRLSQRIRETRGMVDGAMRSRRRRCSTGWTRRVPSAGSGRQLGVGRSRSWRQLRWGLRRETGFFLCLRT